MERVDGQYVSGNYDAVVGAPMALGRGFHSEEDRRPGGSPLAVISHDYWITRLGGRADVVGQPITVDDRTVTIIGVTAPGFHGLNAGGRFHIALPMSMMALDSPRFFDTYDGWVGLNIVGRLAPGVSESQAQAAVDVLLQQFLKMPESGWANMPATLRSRTAALVSAARGTFSLRREYSKPLWVLMAMVARAAAHRLRQRRDSVPGQIDGSRA